MGIEIKYAVGDVVYFFCSGKKGRCQDITKGKIVHIYIYINSNAELCTVYTISDNSGRQYLREEEGVYSNDFTIRLVSECEDEETKRDIQKAYETLGKALGLI